VLRVAKEGALCAAGKSDRQLFKNQLEPQMNTDTHR